MDRLDIRPSDAKVEMPSRDGSGLLHESLNEPRSDSEQGTSDETFQWTRQWYPLAVVDYLDPKRPHAMQLLGRDVVLWRDGTGSWRCFEDACPHRLAPLSEGRIEADGRLLCAYHAWRFDGSGKCDRIPQAKDSDTEAANCNNPRACVASYPTQERQGLLWVWGESGEAAAQSSQVRSPRTIPELEGDSDKVIEGNWNFRDLPYGWDFFLENVADPAHAPVSHHGLIGNRYTSPKFYDMPQIREMTTQEGCAYEVTNTPDGVDFAAHDFQPPCLMQISTKLTDGGQLILALYATPTRPGWCRHIGQQILIKNDAGKLPKGLAFFGIPMPAWLSHVLASLFLHQDMAFLHYQEQTLAKRQSTWQKEVYTPNPQDKMVVAFRQWLEKRAGGGVPWPDSMKPLPNEMPKEQIFDVWHTHTKSCQVCQQALSRIDWVMRLAYGAAVVLFGIALMIDTRAIALKAVELQAVALKATETTEISHWSLPPTEFWIVLLLAVLLGAIGYGLQRFRQLFYRYEFEHFQND